MTFYNLREGSVTQPQGLPLAVALGSFDGLHLGHRELINSAKCSGEHSCVFTFYDNPFGSLRIMSLDDKLEALRDMGVEYAAVYHFEDISGLEWKDFIDQILIEQLDCRVAVCGFNFRFGHNAQGDAQRLSEYLKTMGRHCIIKPPVVCGGETVSSSRIRALLCEGDCEGACELLGRPYFIKRRVSHGNGIGNTLGFPTINFPHDEHEVSLSHGVYVTRTMGRPSVTNVGIRPSVTSSSEVVNETFIIDYEGDLYGENLKVEFLRKIRDELKFSSLEALSSQIAEDVEEAKRFFKV